MAKAAEEFCAVGRRKTSVARIRLSAGSGDVKVNRKSLKDYFGREKDRTEVLRPFEVTETAGKFNVFANVNGGGATGQSGAIRHGITRALILIDPANRPILRKAGFVTRDPRMTERKKPGQKGARARFQFSKR